MDDKLKIIYCREPASPMAFILLVSEGGAILIQRLPRPLRRPLVTPLYPVPNRSERCNYSYIPTPGPGVNNLA